ncbi:MAG: AAA family ATPase [Lawsonibacter sp.]|nr:AAA family ATPase [Lawsonibacter sp.]
MSHIEHLRKHANWYARRGLRVFPCKPRDKVPATAHGCKDATTDPAQIAAWWDGTYLYNVGLATGGGVVVLDVDINHSAGKYGDETLAELEAQHGPLPETWMCLTGGGGVHYYFACDDPALTVGTGFAPGLDYRGAGGYVVAPPSLHDSGREYEWEAAHTPANTALAPLPDWLHSLMLEGRKQAPRTRTEAAPEKVQEGGRNDTLYRLACSLRGKGLGEAGITASLLEENRERCVPPLPAAEVEKIAKSAGRYERGGSGHALNWDGTAEPSHRADSPDQLFSLFKPLSEYQEEEAEWIVPGWIPKGQISLIAADGGIGKTTLWCHIIAALSSGSACILDPPGFTREPMKITFMTTEDSVRKKLRKKLRLAGADMDNIITPDFAMDRTGLLRSLNFGTEEMDRVLRYLKPVLCIFDPVQGFTPPKVNMGSRNEMRDCMAPLISIGEDIGTTALIVCHTNKRKGAYGRDRIADSADLWDISRSVMMAGFTEDQGVRYLSNEKNNYAPPQETILFTIDADEQIHKAGTSWKRDREYIQGAEVSRTAPVREDCKAFILQTLEEAGGAMPTATLEETAKSAGYSFSAITRMKKALKAEGSIKYFHTGSNTDRVWHMQLVNQDGFTETSEDGPSPFDEPLPV